MSLELKGKFKDLNIEELEREIERILLKFGNESKVPEQHRYWAFKNDLRAKRKS